MDKKIQNHLNKLNQIEVQRKRWLMVSVFVVVAVLALILDWDYIQLNRTVWVLVTLGFTVAVVWWYWTMRIIRHLVNHKIVESTILQGLVKDVRAIKSEVKKVLSDIKRPK
jgi:O-antigen/teichoic acid export membrane protein